jgi:hypothetical protein
VEKALCVDLGTSSIRAAVRLKARHDATALELGEVFRSSIDRASIPSAIFVDPDASRISFGEQALVRGLRGEKAHLFDASPKAWMSTGPLKDLDECLPGTQVTRKHLLAGLLAQALSATRKGLARDDVNLDALEVRVAHPVWSDERSKKLRQDLAWITSCALKLAGATDSPVPPKTLAVEVGARELEKTRAAHDVVEPVAAALQLFENSHNARELCLVIDVGAGSTDMAVFLSLTPDKKGYRRKFQRAAAPRSVYLAGDFIDSQLLALIRRKAKKASDADMRSVELRRRAIKETLFSRTGAVVEAGVEVTRQELEQQPGIRDMQGEIADAFHRLISESARFLSPFVTARQHRANELNVVFAGGGSSIRFLHDAIGDSVKIAGESLPVRIRTAPRAATALPASVERLAVALGGTLPSSDWPVTSMEPGEWTQRRRGLTGVP